MKIEISGKEMFTTLAAIGVLVATISFSSQEMNLGLVFVSPPSVAIILAGVFGWIILTWDLRQRNLGLWWEGLSKSIMYMGAVGSCLGLIKVMSSLDRPELIGPGVAVAIGTINIATVISFYTMHHARNKTSDPSRPINWEFFYFPVFSFLISMLMVFVILFALKKEGCPDDGCPQKSEHRTPEPAPNNGYEERGEHDGHHE